MLRMFLVVPLFSSGCFAFAIAEAVEKDPRRDGESCSDDDDCDSEVCRGGMCTASSCESSGECEQGFVCDEPPSWVEGLSLGFARGACMPTCDRCPFRVEPRWICGGELCSYDTAPWVDAGDAYDGIVGDPIAVTAEVDLDDGRELVSAQWMWQGEVVASGLEAEIVIEAAGTWSVTLVVTDEAAATGSASVPLHVCVEAGQACAGADDCCEGLECVDDVCQ